MIFTVIWPGVVLEVVRIMAGVAMGPYLERPVVKKARPVVIAHMTTGTNLVTRYLAQERGAGPCPGGGNVAVRANKATVGSHQIGVVPGGIGSKADVGKIVGIVPQAELACVDGDVSTTWGEPSHHGYYRCRAQRRKVTRFILLFHFST